MGNFWRDKQASAEHNRRIARLGGLSRSVKLTAARRTNAAKGRAVALARLEEAGLPADPKLLWLGRDRLNEMAAALQERKASLDLPRASLVGAYPGYDYGMV